MPEQNGLTRWIFPHVVAQEEAFKLLFFLFSYPLLAELLGHFRAVIGERGRAILNKAKDLIAAGQRDRLRDLSSGQTRKDEGRDGEPPHGLRAPDPANHPVLLRGEEIVGGKAGSYLLKRLAGAQVAPNRC